MQQKIEEKYSNSHLFYFAKGKFTINLAGFETYDKELFNKYKADIVKVQESLKRLENGEKINTTQGWGVDHYNLRHPKELVEGKSLKHSLSLWETIKKKVEELIGTKKYEDIIFNGIGGSYLGPVMMVIFEKGPEYYYGKMGGIKLHFIANSDSDSFANAMSTINLKKTLLVTMSKSGGTAETMTNYACFNRLLEKEIEKDDFMGNHNICITTKGSKLEKIATEKKFAAIFHMNQYTGGRTSVGSAIGMVPAAFAGIDFSEFLRGESTMDELTRNFEDMEQNPALMIALSIHDLTLTKGFKNMIVLGYSDFLKEYAHYLQQLYMESLGKQYNYEKKEVREGQSVFGGVGTGEQHAFMQQIQNGVYDCFVKFIHFLKRDNDYVHSNCNSMGRQLLSFVKGTEHALMQNKKPCLSITFEKRDLFNLGLMIALEERIVSFLAFLKNINSYDQPGVELGKKSALQMNRVSKTIEEGISKLDNWKGTAQDAKKAFALEEKDPIYFIDAVLSDIFANIDVKDSFPLLYGKYTSEREFNNKKFVYTFKKN